MRRRFAIAVGATLIASLAACTVTVGDQDDEQESPTTAGSGQATIADIQNGAPMRWDLREPISAESVGLGEHMAIVEVPDGQVDVDLALPGGVWTTTAEELTVEPREGYVSTINVFRTMSGGQAVRDQLVADADVLGLPVERIDQWFTDDLPASLEPSRAGDPRARTGINGDDGDVATSVEISHDSGPGGDESIRLWYAVRPVPPDPDA